MKNNKGSELRGVVREPAQLIGADQLRFTEDEECRDVWADCRFLRHHCSDYYQLYVLLLKKLS